MDELKKLLKLNKDVAERLEHTGYNTLKKIAYANPIKMRKKTWLSEIKIINMILEAKKLIIQQKFCAHKSKNKVKD